MTEDLKPLTDEELALISAIPRPHKNTRSFMERVAELQIAHYKLEDTVEEYIEKTSRRTEEK